MVWRLTTLTVGTNRSFVLMMSVIVLILLMSSQQLEAFARIGRISIQPQTIRIRSRLYDNIGSSTATSVTIEPPIEPKPKILRFKDKLTSMNPITKARQVKEFLNTQLPMLRYLWPRDDLRLRVFLVLSMIFMFLGKWFNVKVPFILQRAIDTVSKSAVVASSAGSGGGSGAVASMSITPGVLQGATAAIAFYGKPSNPSDCFPLYQSFIMNH